MTAYPSAPYTPRQLPCVVVSARTKVAEVPASVGVATEIVTGADVAVSPVLSVVFCERRCYKAG
jgi:hypothetical protein